MTEQIHLLTVVAEAVLEERLVREVAAAGASGWTTTPCNGATTEDRHAGGAADIEGGNIRLDVLVGEEGLEQLWQVLDAHYFDVYAVVAWSAPVRVRRSAKYRTRE